MDINIPIIRPTIDNEFSENKLMCFYLEHTDGSTTKIIVRDPLIGDRGRNTRIWKQAVMTNFKQTVNIQYINVQIYISLYF